MRKKKKLLFDRPKKAFEELSVSKRLPCRLFQPTLKKYREKMKHLALERHFKVKSENPKNTSMTKQEILALRDHHQKRTW